MSDETTTDPAPAEYRPTIRDRIAELERQAVERFKDGLRALCEETGVQPAAVLRAAPDGRVVPAIDYVRYPG
jgi:hypothetical protein